MSEPEGKTCHWYDITLQHACFAMADAEVRDGLGIRLGTIPVCKWHVKRAERRGWVRVEMETAT